MESEVILDKKTCPKCGEVKLCQDFYKSSIRKDGLSCWCQTCESQKGKTYREQNIEKEKLRGQIYREEHKKDAARYYQEITKPRQHALKAKYLHLQGGRCAICKTVLTVDTAKMDHDHRCCPSAAIKDPCERCRRGVLCHSCNLGLGQFRDNVGILREAIDYLQQFDLVRPPLTPGK